MNKIRTITEIYDSSEDSEGQDNSFEVVKNVNQNLNYTKMYQDLKEKYTKHCNKVKKGKNKNSSLSMYEGKSVWLVFYERFIFNSTKTHPTLSEIELRINIFAKELRNINNKSNSFILEVKNFVDKFNKFEKTIQKSSKSKDHKLNTLIIKEKEKLIEKSSTISNTYKQLNRSKTISKFPNSLWKVNKINSINYVSPIKEFNNESKSFEDDQNNVDLNGSYIISQLNNYPLSLPKSNNRDSFSSIDSNLENQKTIKIKAESKSISFGKHIINVRRKKEFVLINPSNTIKMNPNDEKILNCIVNNQYAYYMVNSEYENFFYNFKNAKMFFIYHIFDMKNTEQLFLMLSECNLLEKLKGKNFKMLIKQNTRYNYLIEKLNNKIQLLKKIDFIN